MFTLGEAAWRVWKGPWDSSWQLICKFKSFPKWLAKKNLVTIKESVKQVFEQDWDWERQFAKRRFQTRGEQLNEEHRFLQAVHSDTKYSDNLLIDSYASQWKLRSTRATIAEQELGY